MIETGLRVVNSRKESSNEKWEGLRRKSIIYQSILNSYVLKYVIGAQGRNRTGMEFNLRGILSPLRLPVSPPGHILKAEAGIEPAYTALQAAA